MSRAWRYWRTVDAPPPIWISRPAAPLVVGPRPAHGAEHVSTHDIRTDAFPEALGKIVVGTRRPARFSVYFAKRARADVPAVQLLTTYAEWVLQSLAGAGAVPVERDREVVDAQLGHGILLWFSYASNGPSRNRQAKDVVGPRQRPCVVFKALQLPSTKNNASQPNRLTRICLL